MPSSFYNSFKMLIIGLLVLISKISITPHANCSFHATLLSSFSFFVLWKGSGTHVLAMLWCRPGPNWLEEARNMITCAWAFPIFFFIFNLSRNKHQPYTSSLSLHYGCVSEASYSVSFFIYKYLITSYLKDYVDWQWYGNKLL